MMKNEMKKTITRMMAGTLMAAAVMTGMTAAPAEVQACGGGNTYAVSVQSGYLALRTWMAYDDANIIGELYNGQTVTVMDYCTGSSDYWYVNAPSLGKSGYVNRNYLYSVENGGCYSGSSCYAPSCDEWIMTVSVKSGYLALRNAMAYDDANEIGHLHSGDKVIVANTCTGNSDYWWVDVPSLGRSGYVNCNYLY